MRAVTSFYGLKYLALSVFGFVLIASCSREESEIKRKASERMMYECVSAVTETVDSEKIVQRYCNCFVGFFMNRYSDDDLFAIANDSDEFEARIANDFELAFNHCKHILQ